MAAEDTQAPAKAAEEVVVVAEMPPAVAEKELPPPSAMEEQAGRGGEDKVKPEDKEEKKKEEKSVITQSVSFKEETNVVGELPDSQKKALEELKQLVREALEKREFTTPPPPPPKEEKKSAVVEEKIKKEETKEEKLVETTASEVVVAEEPHVPPPAKAKEEEAAVVVEEVVEKVEEVSTATIKTEEPTAAPAPEPTAEPEAVPPSESEEVSLWGVPLLGDEKSDVILLKFLRARDFKPKEALAMIKSTVRWRKEFGIEALLGEDLGAAGLEEVVYMHRADRDGHPVCYNMYGELGRRKELYETVFADEEKRKRFLKWRVQFMERSIEKHIDFSPTGVCTFVQVNDLKNSPGLLRREVWAATNKVLQLLQDNYPEFVAKQVFINVPWWYLLVSRMISPFVTQRTKSKFVFATPSKTSETLFKYIAPEQVPVQFGGLSREGEQEFTVADPATEITIKPAAKHTVEFPVSESCEVVWELRVVGSEVSYGAEFVPATENSYTVIVSKTKKLSTSDGEPIICDSFKATEPGKLVITIDNHSAKKKKIILYRSKIKPVA
ncbi:hypothetical protein CDL15_Pgr027885 [Punica granatum]|uniref:Patellin-3-like n=1 Tax=Punica granatum TaxID=22663 RepID=A0A218XJW8_PUNGR|nr:hypothetical protein CDL15_Pgr027885 [Punica granatum]